MLICALFIEIICRLFFFSNVADTAFSHLALDVSFHEHSLKRGRKHEYQLSCLTAMNYGLLFYNLILKLLPLG